MNSDFFNAVDLLSYVSNSQQLTTSGESKVWFAQLNIKDLTADHIPDGGQLAEYLVSKLELPEVHFFLLLIERTRSEEWHESPSLIVFQELIEVKIRKTENCTYNYSGRKRGSVWKNIIALQQLRKIFKQNPDTPFEAAAKFQQAAIINADHPLQLEVLNIQKPWGYEGWYTGVEKRGVVKVTTESGKTELPYALSLFKKDQLAAYPEELILLKTLNPVADDVVGDLYYEMHEKKWEVYVVTEIDRIAWPSGTGIIKAGLNPQKIGEYQDTHGEQWQEQLLNDFRLAIQQYENIRRQIDDSTTETTTELSQKELYLRESAADFVGDLTVNVGDIVSFPAFQMHSLRHGIKVVEFQTPHYERLILMFGQKVLTQDSWDTEEALNKMQTCIYQAPELECLQQATGMLVERFVDFPDFTADRISLAPNKSWKDNLKDKYQLLIIISSQACIIPENGKPIFLEPEQALFLPAGMKSYSLENTGDSPLICLKSMPK
ncbi:MAG: hypothetical protein H8E38_12670 [SAR324 cluster bacterium]|nr:hypothetical protein [SAR324 cluster bacterium]MBL7035332.1 hypothetical protein [SAR324 cluster bacterium]